MKNCVVVLALIILFGGAKIEAKEKKYSMIPAEQFDLSTRLWLARAMVGEAGWLARRDHIAIAYVLKRRWKTMRKRWSQIRFKTVVLSYSKALGGGRREYTARQLWVRNLGFDLHKPKGWPQKISWKRHSKYWKSILKYVVQWGDGKLSDPCRGRSYHWGGYTDIPNNRLFPIDCGETLNTFYGIKKINRQGDDSGKRKNNKR